MFPLTQLSLKGKLAGGLKLSTAPRKRILRSPPTFECPDQLGNWEYFAVPENQGPYPYCTAYGIDAILQASYWRWTGYRFDFDEVLTYHTEKEMDKDGKDGSTLETAIYAVQKVNTAKPRPNLIPPPIPKITEHAMDEASDLPYFIHRFGAVLLGLQITEGWRSPRRDGLIVGDEAPMGGHCIVANWFNRKTLTCGGPNWWGLDWGNNGYWSMTTERFEKEFMGGYGLDIDWGPRP